MLVNNVKGVKLGHQQIKSAEFVEDLFFQN